MAEPAGRSEPVAAGASPPRPKGHRTFLEAVLAVAILGGVLVLVVLPAMGEARIRKNEATAILMLRSTTLLEKDDGDWYRITVAAPGAATAAFENRLPVVGPIDYHVEWKARGYSFSVNVKSAGATRPDVPHSTFRVRANPMEPGVTGRRFFFFDCGEKPLVRFRLGAPASSADSPVE